MAHSRLIFTSVLASALALASVGCGGPKPARAASDAQPSWSDTSEWQGFHSKRFRLWLAFPEGKSWRIDDHRDASLVATHAPSASVVTVSVFAVPAMLNPGDCEREAIAQGLLVKAPLDAPVEDLRIDGKPALVRVVGSEHVVDKATSLKMTEGELRAVVSIDRECVVLRYQTEGSSHDVPALSARLAAIRARMVGALRFDSARTGVTPTEDLRQTH